MHQTDFDLSIDEIAKIEGAAALDLKVRGGKVADLKFRISDYKRFYTQAVAGKPINGVPQQVARICGTCSNAHLLCSIKTIENALNLHVTDQTMTLRKLLNYGLMIRDHALHLYVFVLPDLLGHDSILEFDEQNETEHQLLHDAFAVKEVGNQLSIWAGGRSVHAPYAMLGGFTQLPKESGSKILQQLRDIRPRIQRLIDTFKNDTTEAKENIVFAALDDVDFSFLHGDIITSDKQRIPETEFHNYLQHTVLPYSQASAYKWGEKVFMVGALARVNLLQERLHLKTRKDAKDVLSIFPSNNIFHNNLAQAIEILHSIDSALDVLGNFEVKEEKPVLAKPQSSVGTAVIEAPRGLLFHEYEINSDGRVEKAKIVVPTGLNQILIEQSLKSYLADKSRTFQRGVRQQAAGYSGKVRDKLTLPREKIALEAEKLIRAFDPCISCATHFLRVNWR